MWYVFFNFSSLKEKLKNIDLIVDGSVECLHLARDPVCDVDNQEYGNSCLLAHHNAKLAYRGPCLKRCRHKGQVSNHYYEFVTQI